MRIKRLLGLVERPFVPQSAAFILLAAILSGVVLVTLAHAQAGAAVAAEAFSPQVSAAQLNSGNAALALQLPDAYQKWLDQDARWVIRPEERFAFLQLGSDAERDHFIEQFWLRRDPADSRANSFRAEHYRRLAYANEHFAATQPGGKTDRGYIFIVYGPPTSIDSHPSAASSTNAYEVWSYDSASRVGETQFKFVDTCNCGNYQLQPDPTSPTPKSGDPERSLYERGLAEINAGRTEPGRMALQTLINRYPSSSFATPAQLAIAASWDRQGDPASTIQAEEAYRDARVTLVNIGGDVLAPSLTYSVEPEYTASAKALKEQGTVLINLWVDEQGTPSHLRVIRGIAPDLDGKAIEAVRQYKFLPATQNGTPILVALNIEVNFQIF